MLTITTKTHSYDITIQRGLLKEIGSWLSTLWSPQKIAIITDTRVGSIYALDVEEELNRAGFNPTIFTIPEGESSKSLQQADHLYELLARKGFTRSDGIVALGGGVVGDLAGFVAATYMRGIHFVQVPTSLLAQVDSSIGGKTGVNTAMAKNLIGVFYQPDGVLIDPEVLMTLEMRRVREGIAEIVKSAAIANKDFWEELSTFKDEFELLKQAERVILQALKVKQALVEQDEFDHGARLMLNFGHTLGHAIEKNVGYGKISHGEAVAIGMVEISKSASQKNLMAVDTVLELQSMLTRFHLPTTMAPLHLTNDSIYEAVKKDKKTRGNQIKIILLEEIGQAKIETLGIDAFQKLIGD